MAVNSGAFKKGHKVNNYAHRRIRENIGQMAEAHGGEALRYLVSCMKGEIEGATAKERTRCAIEILDRAYGKSVDMSVVATLSGTSQDIPRLTTAQLIQALQPALEHTPAIDLKSDDVEV